MKRQKIGLIMQESSGRELYNCNAVLQLLGEQFAGD